MCVESYRCHCAFLWATRGGCPTLSGLTAHFQDKFELTLSVTLLPPGTRFTGHHRPLSKQCLHPKTPTLGVDTLVLPWLVDFASMWTGETILATISDGNLSLIKKFNYLNLTKNITY